VRFEYAGEKLLGLNIYVIEEVDSRSFDPFDYPFDFAQGYGYFRAGFAQDRFCGNEKSHIQA
jgi:hypothetical protein